MHNGLRLALTSSILLAFGLACAGLGIPGMGGHPGNKTACEAYVEHMNGLKCMNMEYNKEQMCGMIDQSPVDMESYYDCMRENSTCEGDIPKIDITGCKQPTM